MFLLKYTRFHNFHYFSSCLPSETTFGSWKHHKSVFVSGNSWGYLILLYIFVQVSRCIVVGVLYPFLRYFGYGLDLKEAAILIWSGLRGAVALSLSLSVKASLHGLSPTCLRIYILHELNFLMADYKCLEFLLNVKFCGFKFAHLLIMFCCNFLKANMPASIETLVCFL